jgi:hypothetical protein
VENLLFIDRIGYDHYRLPDGSPVLDPDRHRVTLLTEPQVVGQVRPGECAEVIGIRLSDSALRDALCATLHERIGFDRLFAFGERLNLPGALMRERLGIAGPAVSEILPFRDKSVMKEVASGGGLRVPEWQRIEGHEDADELLRRHGRIVIKPRLGTGSAGIRMVNSAAELGALRDCDLREHQAEEFIDGEILTVNGVFYRGELITSHVFRMLTSTLSHVSNLPMMIIGVHEEELSKAATEFLRRVAIVFGVTNSVLHLELFHRGDGELIFNEVAARNGGGNEAFLMKALTGVNMHEAMVRLALGEPPRAYPRTHPAGGGIVWYSRAGTLAAIEDSAVPGEWLIDRRVTARIGDRLRPSGSSGLGLLVHTVGGRDESQVRERLEFVCAHTAIRYVDLQTLKG